MAKLVNALVSDASEETLAGSSPAADTRGRFLPIKSGNIDKSDIEKREHKAIRHNHRLGLKAAQSGLYRSSNPIIGVFWQVSTIGDIKTARSKWAW